MEKLALFPVVFTVNDIKGTLVYDARIQVQIAYGFAGGRKLDLEAATNVDGKTQFKGLPEKSQRRHAALPRVARQAGRLGDL